MTPRSTSFYTRARSASARNNATCSHPMCTLQCFNPGHIGVLDSHVHNGRGRGFSDWRDINE